MNNKYHNIKNFVLESGVVLPELKIAYQTFGKRNDDKSNTVWAFHALSANADVLEWWPGLFGKNDYFNPTAHFIVCANVIGSPYGSSTPTDLNFPLFTVRDVVKAHLFLADFLNISKINVAIGGSFGGNQALEFAYDFKGKIDNLILLVSTAQESAWGVAIHEAQRMALKADETFGKKDGGKKGVKVARAIAMLTYRTQKSYKITQTDSEAKTDDFKAASYIRYQGDKFEKRFNALSYYFLSKCLDTHNIGRNRGGVEKALSNINQKCLLIGIDSDMLIEPHQQKYMAQHLPNAIYKEIHSDFGHDGFLIETKAITKLISAFLC
ncbi:MAG: homoserine O-acetyltransferase [Flavobacteriaceae bacterium]